MILADYRMQRNQSGFDLRHFVDVNLPCPLKGKVRATFRTDIAGAY
jgi:alpha,alpha-trehalase